MLERTYKCQRCGEQVPESQLEINSGGFSVPYGEGYATAPDDAVLCPYCECEIELIM